MNNLTVFKNQDFGEVRTVTINDEVWFIAKDVCNILDIQNTTQALESLDADERSMFNIGRQGNCNIINESGLYALIIRSRKPEAKKFRKWITSEVIPQIRKTGSYSQRPKSFKEALYLAYKQQEEIELLEKTKAWISDKKTATAMNTASQKSKEVARLQRELEKSKEFASVKAVEIKTKQKFDWKPLRNYCTSHELEMPKIFDSNYGSVRTYPAIAWQEIYGVDLNELF